MPYHGRIFPGIALSGVPVGGLRPAEAERLLHRRFPAQTIEFTYNRRVWRVHGPEVGIERDVQAAVRAAYGVGRTGRLSQRLRILAGMLFLHQKSRIEVEWRADRLKWDSWFGPVAGKAYRAPANASYDLITGEIRPGRTGVAMDGDRTLRRAIEAATVGRNRVAVAVKALPPKTSARQLGATRARHVLARYDTSFMGSDDNRMHNIALAAGRINGTVVPPSGVFSFNGVVGPATLETGFRPAMEIIDRKLVPGVGGGVCQVATTLYNAVLLGGLKVTERRHHSLLLGYVPPGRDATVYYGKIDLRFVNSTGGHLVILAGVVGRRIHVTLIGSRAPKNSYEIVEHVVKEIPPEVETHCQPGMEPGEVRVVREGKPGCRVEVWRLVEDGEQERISVDTYPPLSRVEERGPETGDGEEHPA